MGLYPDHSVEYRIILKDKTSRCITHNIDSRLVESLYYKKRDSLGDWQTRCFLITDPDFDIELTAVEKRTLSESLEYFGDRVQSHGWYDVFSIDDSF